MSLSQEEIQELNRFVTEFGVKNDAEFKKAVHALGVGKAVMAGCEAVSKKFKLDEEQTLRVFREAFESLLERLDKDLMEFFDQKFN